jgi:hypothetical protein
MTRSLVLTCRNHLDNVLTTAEICWAEQMSACIALQSNLENAQLPLVFSGNGHWGEATERHSRPGLRQNPYRPGNVNFKSQMLSSHVLNGEVWKIGSHLISSITRTLRGIVYA